MWQTYINFLDELQLVLVRLSKYEVDNLYSPKLMQELQGIDRAIAIIVNKFKWELFTHAPLHCLSQKLCSHVRHDYIYTSSYDTHTSYQCATSSLNLQQEIYRKTVGNSLRTRCSSYRSCIVPVTMV